MKSDIDYVAHCPLCSVRLKVDAEFVRCPAGHYKASQWAFDKWWDWYEQMDDQSELASTALLAYLKNLNQLAHETTFVQFPN